jgi:hypothetical protein
MGSVRSRGPTRPIHEFLAFEEDLHRRLTFAEQELEKMTRVGPWRRDVTVVDADIAPLDARTRAMMMLRELPNQPWFWPVAAGVAVVVLLALLAIILS